MVYTLTLNPSLDVFAKIDELNQGVINRYSDSNIFVGGKGINVSVMLANLGMKSIAMGICAGFVGDEIIKKLEEKGIEHDFIKLSQGNSRINIKLSSAGDETEINGEGACPDKASITLLLQKIRKIAKKNILVIAGNLPVGVPANFYDRVMRAARCKCIIDIENPMPLLKYKPYLIKPNELELGGMFETKINSVEILTKCAKRVLEDCEMLLVSRGERGVHLFSEKTMRRIYLPGINGGVVSSCGAGDSMLAGFIYGILTTGDVLEATLWGRAAGSATAFSNGIGNGDMVRQLFTLPR